MKIRVALEHRTLYRYDRPVRLGPQVVRLRPAPHCRTSITSYSLQVRPNDHFLNWQQDPQGNFQARLVLPEPTREFELVVDLVAELETLNPFDFFVEPSAETFPFSYAAGLQEQLAPYLATTPQGERFEAYLAAIDRTPRGTVDFLVDFNSRVNADLSYVLRMEAGLQSPERTLELGRGSCRDYAWLQVQLLRRMGLAARFVSGYSIQLVADQKPLEGPSGVAENVADLHAWTEVYIPGAGWVGMDGTCGLFAGEGHLPLACTANPEDAAPITGVVEDCEVEFRATTEVTRLAEAPRSTRPYGDDAWAAILARGSDVDRRLVEADVRLTQGGEPTFVSIDDYVGAEWNVAALGAQKEQLAGQLIGRLRERFGDGGLLHSGQGKWYPGESLPRWSLTCLWRVDGEPIWKDDRWLAQPGQAGQAGQGPGSAGEGSPGRRSGTHEPPDHDDAAEFVRAFATRLGVSPDHAQPAYEDTAYYLWREGRLPINVDPSDAKLDDVEERRRLARIFDGGIGRVVGYVLPLGKRRTTDRPGWYSDLWVMQAGRLLLIPGDSPLGLRLPSASLPWAPAEEIDTVIPQDPLEPRTPLPSRAALGKPRRAPAPEVPDSPRAAKAAKAAKAPRATEKSKASGAPEAGDAAKGVVHTAVAVEPRGGRLCVFLPPTRTVEDYLELVAAVEETAAALRTSVVVEGYLPPSDPRVRVLGVTPDPGVIEVNVHPAASWKELVDVTTGVYEDARQSRLGTEKFLVDGRLVGTGGGNHIVLGGPTPADSPFLRRPHLLRSLIACWNNHPSLTYLFSSLFVGPTSQAPRIDEARDDLLYELEIAFDQIPDEGDVPPWLVDRVFRHLLVDVTGNTHRAEICIDKLYSPDSASGRLGLVEFRSFEMPPHARMSVVQQLLLRSIVSAAWDAPWPRRLVRFGASLHDRYMLPHFVWQDLGDLLAEIERRGVNLERDWFLPQFEFRFPLVGTITHDGVELELRTALEPWHVLGEEPTGGGTARFVDSSVERVQVRVSGAIEGRYRVACNGIEVPLHATGTEGEFVAGVRYRAWKPDHCLHPNIGVHTPLVFDIHDSWSERAIGGCTYHTGHPGGRNYDDPPVNHYEAEARRRARFVPFGHTPGTSLPRSPGRSRELPFTLDLRRVAGVAKSAPPEPATDRKRR